VRQPDAYGMIALALLHPQVGFEPTTLRLTAR
jgi:hypothetical protein